MHKQFSWKDCVSNFTPSQTRELAAERGVAELTIKGLRDRDLIGSCYVPKWKEQCLAFPIFGQNGDVYRAHCRSPQRDDEDKWRWAYEPARSSPIPAFVIGNPDTANKRLIFESQWDAISAIDKLNLFEEIDSGETCLIMTRGAEFSNRLKPFKWAATITTEPIAIYAFPQNDDPGRKWLANVLQATGGAYVVKIPTPHKDLGEWIKAGGASAYDIEGAMDNANFEQPEAAAGDSDATQEKPYKPKGNSPTGYFNKKINEDDVLLGDGFLEREGAALLAGPSGIGKSSIAMQMGCCWACGKPAFHFEPPRALRIVMMQHEDSQNDLVRQSAIVEWHGLNKALIDTNFWIETVRGQIGAAAVKIMADLVKWWRADVLILNPLTAYHDGDISQNKDNVRFLYSELGRLLSELRIALFAFHHKGKPPRGGTKNGHEDVYHEIMYEVLGGSVLTNFFRGIITVSPIPNSAVYRFTVAKRFRAKRMADDDAAIQMGRRSNQAHLGAGVGRRDRKRA